MCNSKALMLKRYFSFSGRLNRKPYLIFIFLYLALMAVVLTLVLSMVMYQMSSSLGIFTIIVAAYAGAFALFVFFIASFPITARRFHDRNRSAWWLLLFYFFPSILMGTLAHSLSFDANSSVFGLILQLASGIFLLWVFIELCVLKGTSGPNRYGPDPLASE